MKIYVAAPWSHFAEARAAMRALEARGHTITYDWTVDHDEHGDVLPPPDVQIACARRDLDAVMVADALLVLTVDDPAQGCGMWVELGAALALGKRVVICGPKRHRTVFCWLAADWADDWRLGIERLERGAMSETRVTLPDTRVA